MISEVGIIVKKEAGNTVSVEAVRHSACEACVSKGFCNTGNGNKMTARAINLAGADIGDRVVMEIARSTMVKITALLYLTPVLALIGGAFAGDRLAASLFSDAQAAAAICGFGAFFVAVVIVVVIGRRTDKKDQYMPKVTRIIESGVKQLKNGDSV